MYTIDISTSKYNFTCSGFLKTTDITKLAYKYWYKQADGGKFPKEMKANINALYIFLATLALAETPAQPR